MKTTHEFNTTLGNVATELFNAVKVYTCGINVCKELQIQVFTNQQETAGYIVYLHIPTGRKTYKRIQVSYIDQSSRLKYGRGNVAREMLPIIRN
jgi:hypothetical protein